MSRRKRINWGWLQKKLDERGISHRELRMQHHFSPATLRRWDAGGPVRPHSLRKLAAILGVEHSELARNLGVRPMTIAERRALTAKATAARAAD